MEYNDFMIENFKRFLLLPNFIDIDNFSNESTKVVTLQKIYEVTRSKTSTSLVLEGKPDFTIIDAEPQKDDKDFVTTIMALHPIQLNFRDDFKVNLPEHKTCINLNPGDLAIFVGLEYENILLQENHSIAHMTYHFHLFKYRLKKKQPNGTGMYKYKASIVFSDKYEVEIFADNEQEAYQIALQTPLYDWDHIFEIDKDKADEYIVQQSRHSLWLPEQILVKKDGE
jgi:hypothetical protein